MTTLQILRRGLRRVRKGWTKGTFARDAKGRRISNPNRSVSEDCDDRRVAKWCLLGAINNEPDAAMALCEELSLVVGGEPAKPAKPAIVSWNDDTSRSKSEVIDLFKRAIKREEGKS